MSFVPDEPFGDEEKITVIIPEVEDLAGNKLESDFQKTFSTGLGVWPGDTNNDGKVDARDIVPIGRHWGSEGEKRIDMSADWKIYPVIPWPDKMATYADANGDGTVNESDILPIVEFWNGGNVPPAGSNENDIRFERIEAGVLINYLLTKYTVLGLIQFSRNANCEEKKLDQGCQRSGVVPA